MLCLIQPATNADKRFLYPERTPWKYQRACINAVSATFAETMNVYECIYKDARLSRMSAYESAYDTFREAARTGIIGNREMMLAYLKQEGGAKVKYELGTYAFFGTVLGYKFFLRCHECPHGNERDYYIIGYDTSLIIEIDMPKKNAVNTAVTNLPHNVKSRTSTVKQPPSKTDWSAIGRLMRDTGMNYGELQIRNML